MKKRKKTKKKPWIDYEQRSECLKRLGFASYGDYLKSSLWRRIRSKVLARDWYRCRLCGKTASQVHHSRYDLAALSGRDLSRLAAVCPGCHKRIERDGAGHKRPAEQVSASYRILRRKEKARRHLATSEPEIFIATEDLRVVRDFVLAVVARTSP